MIFVSAVLPYRKARTNDGRRLSPAPRPPTAPDRVPPDDASHFARPYPTVPPSRPNRRPSAFLLIPPFPPGAARRDFISNARAVFPYDGVFVVSRRLTGGGEGKRRKKNGDKHAFVLYFPSPSSDGGFVVCKKKKKNPKKHTKPEVYTYFSERTCAAIIYYYVCALLLLRAYTRFGCFCRLTTFSTI